jgi:hypothetical protein
VEGLLFQKGFALIGTAEEQKKKKKKRKKKKKKKTTTTTKKKKADKWQHKIKHLTVPFSISFYTRIKTHSIIFPFK